ncbi:MAG TPA: hypothetical protein VKR58_02695 [Aquella sp.]|nr:hypothetical protein [Aquella sp.]
MKTKQSGVVIKFFVCLSLSLCASLTWGFPSEVGDCLIKINAREADAVAANRKLPNISFRWAIDEGKFSITSVIGETELSDAKAFRTTGGETVVIKIFLRSAPYNSHDKRRFLTLTKTKGSTPKDDHMLAAVDTLDSPEAVPTPSNTYEVQGGSCTIKFRDIAVDPLSNPDLGIRGIETIPVKGVKIRGT